MGMTPRLRQPVALLSVLVLTAAAMGACGGSVDDGAGSGDDRAGVADAGEAGAPSPHAPQAGGSVACVRSPGPFKNPAICPAHYWLRSTDRTCAPLGTQCVFPTEGDDCATAVMRCIEDEGGDAGAGREAGTGRWIYGQ